MGSQGPPGPSGFVGDEVRRFFINRIYFLLFYNIDEIR